MYISTNSFDLVKCFCVVDDFFKELEVDKRVGRPSCLTTSELITISLIGQKYEIRCLKRLYNLIADRFNSDFTVGSYKSFVLNMHKASKSMMIFIFALMKSRQETTQNEVLFVDGTKIEVCKIYRELSHKTMKKLATKSKSTVGWWYGMKLHILTDFGGNLVSLKITTAKTSEREVLKEFLSSVKNNIVVGDAGYLSEELEKHASLNNNIVLTAVRKNMKTLATIYQNKCMNMRSRVETVFDVLKERFGLQTSLSRSINGYLSHYIRVLFNYMIMN